MTDPSNKEFNVDFEFSLLGYDLPSGRLDIVDRGIRRQLESGFDPRHGGSVIQRVAGNVLRTECFARDD